MTEARTLWVTAGGGALFTQLSKEGGALFQPSNSPSFCPPFIQTLNQNSSECWRPAGPSSSPQTPRHRWVASLCSSLVTWRRALGRTSKQTQAEAAFHRVPTSTDMRDRHGPSPCGDWQRLNHTRHPEGHSGHFVQWQGVFRWKWDVWHVYIIVFRSLSSWKASSCLVCTRGANAG